MRAQTKKLYIMKNQWIFNSLKPELEAYKTTLAKQLNINPILAKLLADRGIYKEEEAKAFFNPDLKDLHDPFGIKDMDKAVERLNRALQTKEKILVYGDYDVDGTTAVALVYRFLSNLTSNLGYYVPDRYGEGYGISKKGVEYAKDNDFTLVIALDCGIKAVERVEEAKQMGIDFIICDHHTTDEQIPDAVAVLDSKRLDDSYPYKDLSGCGVGFKLMHAFSIKADINFSLLETSFDLLALSIAADIVPITGENRILAYYGLKRLNESPSLGIKHIIDVCKLSKKASRDAKGKQRTGITISDIVFKIGPRINASGRMHSGSEVVELLVTKDVAKARELSKKINRYNEDRRDKDRETTEAAKNQVKLEINENNHSIVAYDPSWHKGIVGIVASRLTEEYYKPTIVLTNANGLISGSARSVQGFDIYNAIDSCRDLLDSFGGHMYAAGLSLKEENFKEFKQRFENYVSQHITDEQKEPRIEVDTCITFKEIDSRFIFDLNRFEPFGPGNERPVFVTQNIYDAKGSKLVGKNGEHLRLVVEDKTGGRIQTGIAFGNGKPYFKALKQKEPLQLCYTLEENYFNGNTTTQLMVKDIKMQNEI